VHNRLSYRYFHDACTATTQAADAEWQSISFCQASKQFSHGTGQEWRQDRDKFGHGVAE
jgi:hypothetical protein